ncbi:MAG: DNA/RNA nuclease SfsA [Methanobacteriaceae archaeon]|nr:DNA/RNA nuclease SfsA [Candidatus Methanorudis spinitermitis]
MSEYIKAIFKKRPNRFIAEVEIDGKIAIAHVPNTGRCKELLVDGAIVYLLPNNNPKRKTQYSLHFVENNNALVSIYSQLANKIVYEAILDGKIKELNSYSLIKQEKTVGNSRIDIYLANDDNDCFVEVKGVTLVRGGVAMFPDAPTERGRKHLNELIELRKNDHRAIVFFLIQHPNGNSFRPNWENDPDFAKTLAIAHDEGVEILVYKCENRLDKIELIGEAIEYDLKIEK